MKYYISLPEGIEHKIINGQDHLIDKTNKLDPVNIQALIKDHIRNPNKGHRNKINPIDTSLPNVKIYISLPNNVNMEYLTYIPKNNGTLPSDSIVKSKSYGPSSPATNPAAMFNGPHVLGWIMLRYPNQNANSWKKNGMSKEKTVDIWVIVLSQHRINGPRPMIF